MTARPADAGFTLLELLVVIVIIGLMLSLIPNLSAGLERVRLQAAADEVAVALEEGQQAAVTTGRRVDVTFDPIHPSFTSQRHPPSWLAPVVRRLSLTPVSGETTCHDMVRFFPDGTAFGCEVILISSHATATIMINSVTGRVYRE